MMKSIANKMCESSARTAGFAVTGGTLAFILAAVSLIGARAQAYTKGGTYDLVQILSDQRVRSAINMAEVGEIKKLGDGTYQVVYGQCALIASVVEECTQIPDPPSCQQKVQFNPEHVNCKP